MVWSFSSYRGYKKCQKQWFFRNKLASWKAKDSLRKEANVLKNLDSVESWRGKIVEYTIDKYLILKIIRKEKFDTSGAISFANKLCRDRYDFAKAKKYREGNISKTKHERTYSAFYHLEYQSEFDPKKKFKQAWLDIETALRNLFNNESLINDLLKADRLVTQRALTFKINNFSVRGVPDLIIFHPNKPPPYNRLESSYFWYKGVQPTVIYLCNWPQGVPKSKRLSFLLGQLFCL